MGKDIETQEATQSPRASIHDGEVIDVPEKQHGAADVALDFVEKHEGITYTPEEERKLVRKIDMYLMPLMFVSYVIQYMDKSVMAQAAVYDLQTNLNLKGQDYSWCSSLFYFGYLAFQPIAAVILTYLRPGKFVAATSLAWAIILFCTAGAHNFAGMAVCRFVLGMAEGGVSPAYVQITGAWYTQAEIPLRMTIWFCGNGLAIILQSLIAYGIGHIHTGIAIWKWFFIIFGILGIFWAGMLYLFMPDNMLNAKFLNDREKAIAVERIRANRTGIQSPKFKKQQFMEAITDLKVWWAFFYTIVWMIPCTAVASFGSLVIRGFGFGTFESSLLNMPLGATEIIGLLTAGLVARNYPNTRCLMQIMCNIPAVVGAALINALPQDRHVGRLIGFYITNFTNGVLPMLWALTNSNIAGHTKRTTTNAIMFVGYSAGFIIGPQFFLGSEAPAYPTGFRAMVICFSIATVMPVFYFIYITILNRSRAKKLAESGEASVRIRNEEFYDLTDKEQLHFVYVR